MSSSSFVSGAGGANIFFKTLGKGLPLLLLHGGPGADHSDFLPHLQPLARKFQLVLVDQRGSGRSERLTDVRRYTLDYMVQDLEKLRVHLGLKRWAVLGHSFGGILAQAYATRHPQRVAGLILAGTASSARSVHADFAKIRRATPKALRARLTAYEQSGIFQPDGQYTRGYATATSRAFAPYMYAKAVPKRLRASPPIGMEVLREMWVRRSDFRIDGNLKGFDFTRLLSRVRAPSLVVIGDRDMVSPASAEETRAALPRATLVVMAECAHMMFVDQTERFNYLLEGFLRSLAGGR